MFTAITIDNRKIEPDYNVIAFCGNCGNRVRPKCVTPNKTYLKRKHFFHEKGVCCDDWYEPLSEWHYEWQSYVPIEQREVSIDENNTRHIADIYLTLINPPVVVELQKSPLPYDVKTKRDVFYKRIIWLIHPTLKNSVWVLSSPKPIFIDLLNETIQTPRNEIITKQSFIGDILLNPNFKYEDWIYGFDGEYIHTKFGKKTVDEIITGDHIVVKTQTTIISQCLLCNKTIHQHQTQNDLIYINKTPHFQCAYCGRIYSAYIVKYDPRGDDQQKDIQEFKLKMNPHGSAMKAQWVVHKEHKLKMAVIR